MRPTLLTLIVFVLSYLLFICLPRKRAHVAVGASLLLILTGILSPKEAFFAINWNVMGIFVGMLVVADVFMDSRVPAYLAEQIVNRAKNTAWAILFICMLSSFISAFVENVATVLIVAPIALSLAKRLKLNPTYMMFAIAISSNLQGAATLIGDPPSMLLGGFAHMTFNDFFWYHGRPSIFFAVEIGALVSFAVLYLFFKSHREKVKLQPEEKVKSWIPTGLLVLLIGLLAVSSFADTRFSYMAGVLCMVFGGVCLVWDRVANRGSLTESIRSLDWETTFFLAGVFILVGSVIHAGWIEKTADFLSDWVGPNLLFGYILLIGVAVLFSAFVDNVPFLAAMLPVAIGMSERLGIQPSLLLFALLIGASLGGNLTPIGASANIVACGQLKKEGHEVRFGDFFKIGFPFTAAAVLAASVFVWFVWRGA